MSNSSSAPTARPTSTASSAPAMANDLKSRRLAPIIPGRWMLLAGGDVGPGPAEDIGEDHHRAAGELGLLGDDQARADDPVVIGGGGQVADVDTGLAQGLHQRVVGRDRSAAAGEDEALLVETDGLTADRHAVEVERRRLDRVARPAAAHLGRDGTGSDLQRVGDVDHVGLDDGFGEDGAGITLAGGVSAGGPDRGAPSPAAG